MKKLSKIDIKNMIIDIVKSKLWVFNKEYLIEICENLQIEYVDATKDELIERIRLAGIKKKSIFFDI